MAPVLKRLHDLTGGLDLLKRDRVFCHDLNSSRSAQGVRLASHRPPCAVYSLNRLVASRFCVASLQGDDRIVGCTYGLLLSSPAAQLVHADAVQRGIHAQTAAGQTHGYGGIRTAFVDLLQPDALNTADGVGEILVYHLFAYTDSLKKLRRTDRTAGWIRPFSRRFLQCRAKSPCCSRSTAVWIVLVEPSRCRSAR